jgi:hypothetical protein
MGIGNGYKVAEQGGEGEGEGEGEGAQYCIADETGTGNGSLFAEQDKDEGTQGYIAKIDITEPCINSSCLVWQISNQNQPLKITLMFSSLYEKANNHVVSKFL